MESARGAIPELNRGRGYVQDTAFMQAIAEYTYCPYNIRVIVHRFKHFQYKITIGTHSGRLNSFKLLMTVELSRTILNEIMNK